MFYDVHLTTDHNIPINCSASTISSQNVLAFACNRLNIATRREPVLGNKKTNGIWRRHIYLPEMSSPGAFYGVYLVSLQRPWNVVPVFGSRRKISWLVWSDDGKTLLCIDGGNIARIYQCTSGCLNNMSCLKIYDIASDVLIAKHYSRNQRPSLTGDLKEASGAMLEHTSTCRKNANDNPSNSFLCVTETGRVLLLFVEIELMRCWDVHYNPEQFDMADLITYGDKPTSYCLMTTVLHSSPLYIYEVKLSNDHWATSAEMKKLQGSRPPYNKRSVCFMNPNDHRKIGIFVRSRLGFELQVWELMAYTADVRNICSTSSGNSAVTKFGFSMTHLFKDSEMCDLQLLQISTLTLPSESKTNGSRIQGHNLMSGACQTVKPRQGPMQRMCPLTSIASRRRGLVMHIDRNDMSQAYICPSVSLEEDEAVLSFNLTWSGLITALITNRGRVIVCRTFSRMDTLNTVVSLLEFAMMYNLSYWDVMMCIDQAHVSPVLQMMDHRYNGCSTEVQKVYFETHNFMLYFLETLITRKLPRENSSFVPACDHLIKMAVIRVLNMCRNFLCHFVVTRDGNQRAKTQVTDFAQEMNYVKFESYLSDAIESRQFVERVGVTSIPHGLQRMCQWCLNVFAYITYNLSTVYPLTKTDAYDNVETPGVRLLQDMRFLTYIRELLLYFRVLVRLQKTNVMLVIDDYFESSWVRKCKEQQRDVTNIMYSIFSGLVWAKCRDDDSRSFERLRVFRDILRPCFRKIVKPEAIRLAPMAYGTPQSYVPCTILAEATRCAPSALGQIGGCQRKQDKTSDLDEIRQLDFVNLCDVDVLSSDDGIMGAKVCVNCGMVCLTASLKSSQVHMIDVLDNDRCCCRGLFLLGE